MTINTKEYINRLQKFADGLQESEPVFNAVANTVRNQTVRVFEQGGVGPGGSKAAYGGGALYVNPNTSVRKFPLKGKNGGASKFKNGKPRKTGYFTSYAEFKQTIGEGRNVNLKLFGNLARAYGTGISVKRSGGEVLVFHSIRTDQSNPEGKVKGLIGKYPAAFMPTDRERAEFVQDLENYVHDLRVRVGL